MLALLFASDVDNPSDGHGVGMPGREGVLPDDAELVARIRAGDAALFEIMFRFYAERLVAFVIRYLHVRADAEDVVQEVFLRVWRNHEGWHVRGTVNDYLYLACRNLVRNRIARQVVARRWREQAAAENAVGFAASDVSEVDERHALLIRAIDELPARRREICLLRWREGLSYAEVARRLGVSEKTVENQIGRAFKTLKARLGEPGEH